MGRAWLNDDLPGESPGVGLSIALDEDEADTRWAPTPGGVMPPTVPIDTLPTISIRGRDSAGVDENGVQRWMWRDLVVDQPTTLFKTRTERSDSAGVTHVQATATILYPQDAPNIPETSSARTGDGHVWRITSATRTAVGYTIVMERLDGLPPEDPLDPGEPGG